MVHSISVISYFFLLIVSFDFDSKCQTPLFTTMSKKPVPWVHATHHCEIFTDSQSCLPKLPPQASFLKRLARTIRKKLMVSRRNPRASIVCRSAASIKAERLRHMQSPWFIIHPFSQFSVIREMLLSIVWLAMYIIEPIMTTFSPEVSSSTPVIPYLAVFIDVTLLLNFITCFVLGYYVTKTKEVVLVPKKIIQHYLKTYCFVDFVTIIPSNTVLMVVFLVENDDILNFTAVIRVVAFLRLGTMLVYLRQITLQFRITDTAHDAICLVIMSLLFFHWVACLTYLVPAATYYFTGSINNGSWTVQAHVSPEGEIPPLMRVYSDSFLTGLCHFLAAGSGLYSTNALEEITLFCVIYVLGMVYMAYMIVVIFEMVRSARASENKYEEIIYQLNMYMVNKELPHELRQRLIMYYKNRFQMRYFREASILATLSEHQRSELFLHSCKELIDNTKLFLGIPKTVIGAIMASLKHEVYLPNDVILKAGTLAESMFFIDKGTVAQIMANGKEVRHLEDSEHFGELALVIDEMHGQRITSYVATEMTECLRLDKKELKLCMSMCDEFAERLIKQAKTKYELILQMEEDEDYIANRKDVLYDLRSGKILDIPRRRYAVEK